MAVYGINGANIMDDVNKIDDYISHIFAETRRANLLTEDLKKWGSRVYNLTIGEISERFNLNYGESEGIVKEYFKSKGLLINHKFHYSNNLYDYPIKDE